MGTPCTYISSERRRGRILGGERRIRRPEKSSSARARRGEPAKWLHWSLSETPMARDLFLPLSLVLSSRFHPNPPSATPVALFISTSQQYPRVYARKRRTNERVRRTERKRRAALCIPRNKLPAVHTEERRRRHHPGHIDRRLFCHPLSRI